jgi:hypothetical protein
VEIGSVLTPEGTASAVADFRRECRHLDSRVTRLEGGRFDGCIVVSEFADPFVDAFGNLSHMVEKLAAQFRQDGGRPRFRIPGSGCFSC